MDIYLVGGAVRDALLARPTEAATHVDRDWVVVGTTPEAMAAQGFLPVGQDFPVFLHPQTREEYALARTERKTAPGYHGFHFHTDPSVTLEEDLARRDLTINAMAVAQAEADAPARAHIIDPHGGQRDLQARVLRHVTAAFAEDPVRILRLARFAARFPDFTVASDTQALMAQMVRDGEVDHLVPERVWQELARGLMEQRPSRLFEVLRGCGALERLLPEVDRLWGVPQRAEDKSDDSSDPDLSSAGAHLMLVLDVSAQLGASLPVRFACLCHDLGKGSAPAHVLPRHLGACRTWGAESENRPQRGQFLPDSQAHSGAMGPEGGEKWTAAASLQPATPKPDRLLGHEERSAQLLKAVSERWRVPRESRELADVVAREHGNIHRSADFNGAAVLRLLERCDALRRPERFADALLACECDARGRLGFEGSAYPQRQRLLRALAAARAVPTEPIAAQLAASLSAEATAQARAQLGPRIAQAVHAARAAAVETALNIAPNDVAGPPGVTATPG